MIILCNKCNKKFILDEKLIPSNGRLLQCSLCNHKWYFSKNSKLTNKNVSNDKKNKPDLFQDNSVKYDLENDEVKVSTENEVQDFDIQEENLPVKDDKKKKKDIKFKNNSSISFLNGLLVLILSFMGIIILLHTFKEPLSLVYPNIEMILSSFFETLIDVVLFIKDLFN